MTRITLTRESAPIRYAILRKLFVTVYITIYRGEISETRVAIGVLTRYVRVEGNVTNNHFSAPIASRWFGYRSCEICDLIYTISQLTLMVGD